MAQSKAQGNKAGKPAKKVQAGAKEEGHSPTLATIRMVEDTLKNMPGSVMKISELKRALPRKVNHNTLMKVIDYLDESNKIAFGWRGICWIQNDSPKLKKAIDDAIKNGRVL
jgi:hypothetical protein